MKRLLSNKALIFSFVLALLYTTITFAAPYAASDAVLNPTCAPGDVDCYVTPTSIGGAVSSATPGSIFFAGTSGVLDQDNAALFFDNTNNYLGINTATPAAPLDVKGVTTTAVLGSEMITATADRDFSSDTGNWTGTNWSIGSGVATHTAGVNSYTLSNSALTAAPVVGSRYQVTYTVSTTTATTNYTGFNISFGGTLGNGSNALGQAVGSVTVSYVIVATNTNPLILVIDNASWTGTLDNVSVKLVTPTNPTQIIRNSDETIGVEIRSGGTGRGNAFVGYQAGLANTSGLNNAAFGYQAFLSNTSGSNNVGIGRQSLLQNTTGSSNTALGTRALKNLVTGFHNVGLGVDSMSSLGTGSNNIGIGTNALYSNTTGSNNIGIGTLTASGGSMVSIANNIFIGYQAADNITTGADNNIVIGYDIDLPTAGGDNQMSIGNLIFATGLGATGTTVSTGFVGIGMNNPSVALDVTGDIEYTGTLTDTSDSRLKENVQDINDTLTIIRSLNAKSYNMIGNPRREYGFIAQEVQPFFPDAVSIIDPTNEYLGINYISFIPLLADAVKDLDASIISIQDIDTDSSFVSNLKAWLASATNGIESIVVRVMKTDRVETKEICVGSTCLTESQLIQLMQNNQMSSSSTGGSGSTTGTNGDNSTTGGTDTTTTGDSSGTTDTGGGTDGEGTTDTGGSGADTTGEGSTTSGTTDGGSMTGESDTGGDTE